MVHVFVDTNVFLHFISFTEFDWKELVGDKSYKLVIPLTIISELDKKKTHQSKKIADKAKATLEKFNKVMEGHKLDKLEIVLLSQRPKNDIYLANDLSNDEPDDRILASIIDYQTNDRKVLVSNDTAIRVRAKYLGIEYLTVPSEYLITESTDEEKEIKDLKNQLKQQQDKTPKLRLNFNNDSNVIEFEKRELDENLTEEDYIARESFKIKLKPIDLNDPFIHLEQNGIEAGRQYNRELIEYKSDCTIYFRDNYYHALYIIKTYELRLILDNKLGSVPAEKVEIKLNFPDDVKADIKYLKSPQSPETPHRSYNPLIMGYRHGRKKYQELNYSKIFDNDKKQSIIYNIDDVKHHKEVELDPVYITFKSLVHSFSIDYTILADNVGQKLNGKLNIIIK